MQKILMLTLGFGFYYAFGLDGIIYGLAASYIPFTIIVYKICRESEINFSLLKITKPLRTGIPNLLSISFA